MSKYIGKRVSYPCGQCGKQITLSKRTIDDSSNSGEVFCSEKCFEKFSLAHVGSSASSEVKYCRDGKRICDCMGLVCSK